jgi:Ca2+:H+ antiporter
MLFLSYIIGLWFTLRTHAAVIWNNEVDEKKTFPIPAANGTTTSRQNRPPQQESAKQRSLGGSVSMSRSAIRDSQLYKRILGQSLRQVGLSPGAADDSQRLSATGDNSMLPSQSQIATPYLVPPKHDGTDSAQMDSTNMIEGLSDEQNARLVRQVAEMAATAATVAARDAVNLPRKISTNTLRPAMRSTSKAPTLREDHEPAFATDAMSQHAASGGHDAPNWSRLKSAIILCGATVLYAVIAEILVNTVDVVLESVDIDEKFLGITLFALVPNTTEFLVSIAGPVLSSLLT